MSFKTAKIAAVVAAQLCWIALTYAVFGGFGDASRTTSWMVMVGMVLLLPMTLCLWYALNLIAGLAARAPSLRPVIFVAGGALTPPLMLAVATFTLSWAIQVLMHALPVPPTPQEIMTLAVSTTVPGLAAGLVMLFAAPPLQVPTRAPMKLPTLTAMPAIPAHWREALSALLARASVIEIREPYAVLIKPTLRAGADPYRRSGLVLAQATGVYVMAAAAYQFSGQPWAGLLGPVFTLGQIAIGWAFLCLLANRLRALGAPPALALAPAALAVAFVATSPPGPDWLGPLCFLLVYVISAIALWALRPETAPLATRP